MDARLPKNTETPKNRRFLSKITATVTWTVASWVWPSLPLFFIACAQKQVYHFPDREVDRPKTGFGFHFGVICVCLIIIIGI